MEDLYALQAIRLLDFSDFLSRFIRTGIAARSQHHANGRLARPLKVALADPADVKVTIFWTTSTVPPDPKSTSQELLDDRLASGDHVVQVPEHVPPNAAFATVKIDAAIYAFSIATEQ